MQTRISYKYQEKHLKNVFNIYLNKAIVNRLKETSEINVAYKTRKKIYNEKLCLKQEKYKIPK